jgi:hypothetical protein
MADIEEVYKNKDGGKITKIINENDEVILVESFINSNEELEYNTYKQEDGGVIELISEDDESSDSNEKISIKKLYEEALANLLENM